MWIITVQLITGEFLKFKVETYAIENQQIIFTDKKGAKKFFSIERCDIEEVL